jgi:hypothetical protein
MLRGQEFISEESQCIDEDLIEEFLELNEEIMELDSKEELEACRKEIMVGDLAILVGEVEHCFGQEDYKEVLGF